MKTRDFTDFRHASNYLHDSIISYREKPVLVTAVNPISNDGRLFSLRLKYLGKIDPEFVIDFPDNDIDMTPMELGFINYKQFGLPTSALIGFRIPERAWKVGLTLHNFVLLDLVNRKNVAGPIKNKVFTSSYLQRTMLNNFPRIGKVVAGIKADKATSGAFSRRFAIDADMKVYYYQLKAPVGVFNGEAIRLNEGHEYLIQVLTEDVG